MSTSTHSQAKGKKHVYYPYSLLLSQPYRAWYSRCSVVSPNELNYSSVPLRMFRESIWWWAENDIVLISYPIFLCYLFFLWLKTKDTLDVERYIPLKDGIVSLWFVEDTAYYLVRIMKKGSVSRRTGSAGVPTDLDLRISVNNWRILNGLETKFLVKIPVSCMVSLVGEILVPTDYLYANVTLDLVPQIGGTG